MSGGSQAPQAPNLSGLIGAATQQQQQYQQLGQNATQFAQNAYNTGQPIYQGVAGTDVGNQGTSSGLANTQAAQYEQLYAPLAQQFVGAVGNYTSPDQMALARGQAESAVSDQYTQAGDAAKRQLETSGVDPSAARFGGLDESFRTQQAAATAAAGTQSDVNRTTTGLGLDATALNIGNSTAAGANQSVGTATGAGGGASSAESNSYTPYAGALGNPLGYYGLSSNALGLEGQFTNQQFSNEMSQFNADQNASSGVGAGLGAIGGIGASLLSAPQSSILGGLLFKKGGVVPGPSGMGGQPPSPTGRQSVPTIGGRQFALPRGLHRISNVPLTMKFDGGGEVPSDMSPSGGAVTDDIPATVGGQAPGTPPQAHINAGEFIFDKPSTQFYGSKHLHGLMDKAHKAMGIGRHAGAVDTSGGKPAGAVNTHALQQAGKSPAAPRVDMSAGRHNLPTQAFNAVGRAPVGPPKFAQHFAHGGNVLPFERVSPGAGGGAGRGPAVNLGGHQPFRPSGAGALGSSSGAVRSPIPGV